MAIRNVLIVGAQRGLGFALANRYSQLLKSEGEVFATMEKPAQGSEWQQLLSVEIDNAGLPGICCMLSHYRRIWLERHRHRGSRLYAENLRRGSRQRFEGKEGGLGDLRLRDSLPRGEFKRTPRRCDLLETACRGLSNQRTDTSAQEFGSVNWDHELEQYKIVSIAPVIVIEKLCVSLRCLAHPKIDLSLGSPLLPSRPPRRSPCSPLRLVACHSGRSLRAARLTVITVRYTLIANVWYQADSAPGSKAAGNMVGHLLSYNLKEKGHPIVMINVSSCVAIHVMPGAESNISAWNDAHR